MAILAPGVAQFRIVGHIDGLPWNSLVYFATTPGTAWTSVQLSAVADAVLSGMAAVVNTANFHTTLTWDQVLGVDLGVAAPQLGNSSHASLVGTSTNEMTASNCILINYGISARYRGGKPRTYLPGMISIQQANSNTWLTATFTPFVNAWRTTMANCAAVAVSNGLPICNQAVPTYNYTYTDVPGKHKYTKTRSSYKTTLLVSSVTAQPAIRTQRRRMT